MNWQTATFLTIIMYGLWAWFPKLASMHLDAKSAWLWEVIGFIIAAALVAIIMGAKPTYHPKGTLFAILTGAAGVIGTLFFFIAISKQKAGIITTATALYPIITILLSVVFLKETFTLKQIIGILLALSSIFLISS